VSHFQRATVELVLLHIVQRRPRVTEVPSGPIGLAMVGRQDKPKGAGRSGFGLRRRGSGVYDVTEAPRDGLPGRVHGCESRPLEANMLTLLTEHDVSKQLRVSLGSLRRWRMIRQGPPFFKVGPLVRYRTEDVEAWLSAQPTGGGAQSQRKAATDRLSA
jgi:hypothetical protein